MIFRFPDLDTLRLALTSGVVPPAVGLAPVKFRAENGSVALEPSAALPAKAQTALRQLGVETEKGKATGFDEVGNWLQALPLVRDPAPLSPQAAVLFDLPADQLPTLVGEMLRLGNDRQGFRLFDGGKRALLRVIGPPYYSLLRALDRDGEGPAPVAHVERRPRVWVQIGWTHSLIEAISAPAGQIVLLAPPRAWIYLEDQPFQDIYEILEFPLPAGPVGLEPVELAARMQVPLQLAAGSGSESAELWVLTKDALDQVDRLVREADDQLLARLAFAVSGDIIVLRVRPSKLPAPVLVLDAVACRPYLKLPNLFLPVGQRLQPPLRRDAVPRLLAEDDTQIVWLHPQGESQFIAQSLPDAAFRPLADWVDYVLDHDREKLEPWIASARFAFEPFVCKDEQREPRKPDAGKSRRGEAAKKTQPEAEPAIPEAEPLPKKPEKAPRRPTAGVARPSELQKELADLEMQFLKAGGGLDAPERIDLWPQLAELNARLDHQADAALCWLQSLWHEEDADQARRWAEVEGKFTSGLPTEAEIEQLLVLSDPSPAKLRALVAGLVVLAASPRRLAGSWPARAGQFLEKHQQKIGVRAAWLAAAALAKLAGGDLLGLARTRDRLLDRLLTHGHSGDRDLPGFLRFDRGGDRYRKVRDRLLGLRELAEAWIADCYCSAVLAEYAEQEPCTQAYARLLFAFGLARLGEESESRRLLRLAAEVLEHRGDSHSLLLNAFSHRIETALAGKPHGGPLPAEQLEFLEQLHRDERYKVDRLRQHSHILDPEERFDPYRSMGVYEDKLRQELVRLPDNRDLADLTQRARRLLHMEEVKGIKAESQARILYAFLGVASRLGEELSVHCLERTLEVLNLPEARDPEFFDRHLLPLVEQAILMAGHYGRPAVAEAILAWFLREFETRRLLWVQHDLGGVVNQAFVALRKFGLREVSSRFLERLSCSLLDGKDLAAAKERLKLQWSRALCILLQEARGALYSGGEAESLPVLEEARQLLFSPDLIYRDRTRLACNYVQALGQAKVEVGLDRIEEMFIQIGRLADPYQTNKMYSLSQLDVIEAVVLAVVSDDFAMGQSARRWLDDDEYLVRRRIHRDVRQSMVQAE